MSDAPIPPPYHVLMEFDRPLILAADPTGNEQHVLLADCYADTHLDLAVPPHKDAKATADFLVRLANHHAERCRALSMAIDALAAAMSLMKGAHHANPLTAEAYQATMDRARRVCQLAVRNQA